MIANGLDPVTVASVVAHSDPHITHKVGGHMFDREKRDDAVRLA